MMTPAASGPAPPPSVESPAASEQSRLLRLGLRGLLVALTLLALAVRLNGLFQPDGDLGTDEARLGLAADGVLATGLPVLPSGQVYLRGLVTTYAIAPSFALFGRHDWSARLPSALAGTLLVPVIFLFGRSVAGTAAGLVAATLVVVAEPLVEWSRQAWPPSTFLLLFTLAAWAAYRGFGRDEVRWQPRAALLFLVALLAYEFAFLLLLGVGLYLGARLLRRDVGWWHGRTTVTALAIVTVSLAVAGVFGLELRADSLAGADAEFRHYFTPGLHLYGFAYYLVEVWRPYVPLLLLVPAGWLWCRLAGARPPDGLGFVLALLVVALAVPAFGIQRKLEPHYGLAVVPLIGVAAGWGIAALGQTTDSLSRRRERWLTGAVALAALALVLRVDAAAAARVDAPSRAPTWLEQLRAQGWQPDELVFAEAPLVAQFYLGRADFYIQPDNFERYARQDGVVDRSLYTNAILLRAPGDFARQVVQAHPGETLWVIGKDDRLPRLTTQLEPSVWSWIQERSGVRRPTRGWWLMRLHLPG
ncbi:MAG: glycosyltransferase family 39 protein [Chloroflexi bacterium]|nr:glycosyltransferase family 39 protein [Chloroflexota bacterium]